MRRISAITLFTSALFFASCGNGGSTTSSSDSNEVQPTDSMTNPTDKSLNYSPQEKAADAPPADSSTIDTSAADSMK